MELKTVIGIISETKTIIDKQVPIVPVPITIVTLFTLAQSTSICIQHCEVALFVMLFGFVPFPSLILLMNLWRRIIMNLNVFSVLSRLARVIIWRHFLFTQGNELAFTLLNCVHDLIELFLVIFFRLSIIILQTPISITFNLPYLILLQFALNSIIALIDLILFEGTLCQTSFNVNLLEVVLGFVTFVYHTIIIHKFTPAKIRGSLICFQV